MISLHGCRFIFTLNWLIQNDKYLRKYKKRSKRVSQRSVVCDETGTGVQLSDDAYFRFQSQSTYMYFDLVLVPSTERRDMG